MELTIADLEAHDAELLPDRAALGRWGGWGGWGCWWPTVVVVIS